MCDGVQAEDAGVAKMTALRQLLAGPGDKLEGAETMNQPEPLQFGVGDSVIEIVSGDITEQEVDAIVNAANRHLAGGGGVDGAIHRRGGPEIMAETRAKYPDGCPTGSAVISGAGKLPAKYVIHAVGPIWQGGGHGEAELLASAYRRSLELAASAECRSIAFPALSAGAYGYPADEAARVAIGAVAEYLRRAERPLRVRFVLFGSEMHDRFARVARKLLGGDAT